MAKFIQTMDSLDRKHWAVKEETFICKYCGEEKKTLWFFNRDEKPSSCFECLPTD